MYPGPLHQIAAELLRTFRHTNAPADKVVGQFYREKRFLGSKDRRAISEAYFHALTHLRRIDRALAAGTEDRRFRQSLSRATGFPIDEPPNDRVWANPTRPAAVLTPEDLWIDLMRVALASESITPGFISENVDFFVENYPSGRATLNPEIITRIIGNIASAFHQLGMKHTPRDLPATHSFPDWLWSLLCAAVPRDEWEDQARGLNRSAPACLRVNSLVKTVEEYSELLAQEGIGHRRGQLAANCLILDQRLARGRLPLQREGAVEFQDEGSQLVTELLGVGPGDSVIDACAGAGGKSLQLAALMQGRGRLRVHEPFENRLANLQRRAERAGLHTVEEIAVPEAEGPPSEEDLADLVVLDVPCSGTGTIRRSPELKWRLMPEVLHRRTVLQAELLERWSRWVRPGGRLAYITCSLLLEENANQIKSFLEKHREFQRTDDLAGRVPEPSMVTKTGDVQLLPHRHGTDGFFLCLMRREG